LNLFIISLILKKMHEFTLFRQQSILNDYYYYQIHYPTLYYTGQIFGIIATGYLTDRVLQTKMYTTITFVTILQITYTILSFVFEVQIARGQRIQEFIAAVVGSILGANYFLNEILLPLKLAREITEKKSRAIRPNSPLDSLNCISYAGTVIGATLGFSYLMNTIFVANVTFIIDRIGDEGVGAICALLCGILALSGLMLYRPLRKELVKVTWLRRCCCPNEG
jgi:MFS family permease